MTEVTDVYRIVKGVTTLPAINDSTSESGSTGGIIYIAFELLNQKENVIIESWLGFQDVNPTESVHVVEFSFVHLKYHSNDLILM